MFPKLKPDFFSLDIPGPRIQILAWHAKWLCYRHGLTKSKVTTPGWFHLALIWTNASYPRNNKEPKVGGWCRLIPNTTEKGSLLCAGTSPSLVQAATVLVLICWIRQLKQSLDLMLILDFSDGTWRSTNDEWGRDSYRSREELEKGEG